MRTYLITLAMVAATSHPAFGKSYSDRVAERIAHMTLADFQRGVTVRDDDLSTSATFDTVRALRINQGVLSDSSDVALWATVDKKSGVATFRVGAVIGYSGSGWRLYQAAGYATQSGPVDASVSVERSVDTCLSAACFYSEKLSFDVPESTLRAIAVGDSMWRMRFRSQVGTDRDEWMSPLEVRALLEAVDARRVRG